MNNNYSTRDFYLVSYLSLVGNEIDDSRLVDQNVTEFSFKLDDKLLSDVESFYSHATVSPKSYGNSFRKIKTIIHNLKSGHGTSTVYHQGTTKNVNHKHRTEISRG